jgi:hypothetical protein
VGLAGWEGVPTRAARAPDGLRRGAIVLAGSRASRAWPEARAGAENAIPVGAWDGGGTRRRGYPRAGPTPTGGSLPRYTGTQGVAGLRCFYLRVRGIDALHMPISILKSEFFFLFQSRTSSNKTLPRIRGLKAYMEGGSQPIIV